MLLSSAILAGFAASTSAAPQQWGQWGHWGHWGQWDQSQQATTTSPSVTTSPSTAALSSTAPLLSAATSMSVATLPTAGPLSSAVSSPVAAVSMSAATSSQASGPTSPPYLHELAVKAGKLYFGTATDQPGTGEDTDITYQTILNDTRIFGQVTPGNSMKGVNVEPQLGVFTFRVGQVVVDIAKDHGKVLRCHNLVWANQQPNWLTDPSYHWTRETLLPVMERHIKTTIGHWADVCHAWDVVNEAFASNGSLSASPWLSVIGPDYLPLAFQYAHEAVVASGKNIRLFYNDYGIESPSDKTNAVYQLVTDLKAQGIDIAVGLESHFTVNDPNNYANQVAVMQGIQDLGATFALTELDVRFPALPPNATYSYEDQATRYWESVSACMKFSNCEGITVWDFADKYSWIPGTFPGEGEADLYNEDYSRKIAYQAVADALEGKPCSVCG